MQLFVHQPLSIEPFKILTILNATICRHFFKHWTFQNYILSNTNSLKGFVANQYIQMNVHHLKHKQFHQYIQKILNQMKHTCLIIQKWHTNLWFKWSRDANNCVPTFFHCREKTLKTLTCCFSAVCSAGWCPPSGTASGSNARALPPPTYSSGLELSINFRGSVAVDVPGSHSAMAS